jgi:hypothetical protein
VQPPRGENTLRDLGGVRIRRWASEDDSTKSSRFEKDIVSFMAMALYMGSFALDFLKKIQYLFGKECLSGGFVEVCFVSVTVFGI